MLAAVGTTSFLSLSGEDVPAGSDVPDQAIRVQIDAARRFRKPRTCVAADTVFVPPGGLLNSQSFSCTTLLVELHSMEPPNATGAQLSVDRCLNRLAS